MSDHQSQSLIAVEGRRKTRRLRSISSDFTEETDLKGSIAMENVLPILSAMIRQGDKGYATCDYFQQQQPEDFGSDAAENRAKMTIWCYRIVDFCKFHRETVAITMNILDRFMATPAASLAFHDRSMYQLIVMTCLYTAVKIHEPEAMDPKMVSALSRGIYAPADIEDMELRILMALAWRVNPPTPMAYVKIYLDLIKITISESSLSSLTKIDQNSLETILDLAQVQTEFAIAERDFLTVKPSTLAYCVLMNALLGIELFDDQTLHSIATTLAGILNIDPFSFHIVKLQQWLCERAFCQKGQFTPLSQLATSDPVATIKTMLHQHSNECSPRSV